jgi:uncharacterized protein (TIGR02145 family)
MFNKLQALVIPIIFLIGFFDANSQTVAVKSFRKLESDQEARISFPKADQNGKKCAIIKVVTSQNGFVFDFGLIGNAIATEQKTGEIWVWVPAGARKVTISHQQLGVLREYLFDIDIEEATVYEMVLITGKVSTIVEEEITSQWLVINTEPADAMVYLNDQFVKKGMYQAKLKPGSYTYRIEAPLYHTEAGKIEIAGVKKELNVTLKPAFGYLSMSSGPEQGADVVVDGKSQPKTTPCKSEPLASGEHTVQIVKEMYQPLTQKVTVADGQTTPVNIILRPNFAEVSITAPSEASIYINNEKKGKGPWQGRLNAGIYSLEARLEKYRPVKQDIEVVAGDKRTVELQPIPIFGSLDVITTPAGATITIDGKTYGTTPNSVNKMLIGNYSVQLSKQGYSKVNKKITITEDQTIQINETLVSNTQVELYNEPSNRHIYFDNMFIDRTPITSQLPIGNHTFSKQKDYKFEKSDKVKQEEKKNLSVELKSFSSIGKNTDIDGNEYNIVKIGEQIWMSENLKVTKLNDGSAIPYVLNGNSWTARNTPAYCWYKNNAEIYKGTYGALYNWYTVETGKLCPSGWHVPSDEEWSILIANLGNKDFAGGKLKEMGLTHWNSPNTNATNETGFSANPGGYRLDNGTFDYIGIFGIWWSFTENSSETAWYRYMGYKTSNVIRNYSYKNFGFSIRCLMDE